MQQVKDLLHLYSGLHLDAEDANRIVLAGDISVNRITKGFSLFKEYKIKIVIPLFSDDLPYVIETGHDIDKNYPHRYTDGRLCLETDTCIRIRFIEDFSLTLWMSEYVETYFFSYEYYQRYGEFPFGERDHGIEGVLQTYGELFGEPDTFKVLRLMDSIVSQAYRGHMMCPCGSGKKLRACHGMRVMKYYTDNRFNKIVSNDYQMIREVLEKYNEQRWNSKQTKSRKTSKNSICSERML